MGFLASPWADFEFLTDLLRALREAVLAADPEALTEINVSIDMHDHFNVPFGRPGWEGAVSAWSGWRTRSGSTPIPTTTRPYRSTEASSAIA